MVTFCYPKKGRYTFQVHILLHISSQVTMNDNKIIFLSCFYLEIKLTSGAVAPVFTKNVFSNIAHRYLGAHRQGWSKMANDCQWMSQFKNDDQC